MYQEANKMNRMLKLKILERFKYQADFAQLVKLREERLSRIVNGRVVPTDRERQRIAEALGIPESELFPPQS
jgi:transcriptional regulator with XRE-family HTH domain